MEVSFEEFQNLDIRIGKITAVKEIPDSKNLYNLEVDFGTEKKRSIAGLKKHYSPQHLLDKKFVFVLNLERRKIMGMGSECMILAADDGEGSIVLLQPEKDLIEGSKIK